MIDPTIIEAINAGGNLGILFLGFALIDLRGRVRVLEMSQQDTTPGA